MTAIEGERTPSDAGRDDPVHESGSYDNYGVNQSGFESWPVPTDPQAVPHPRTGTGFAVGPTMPIPAVPPHDGQVPGSVAGTAYSGEDAASGQTRRAAPSPRPHPPTSLPEAGGPMAHADVSRETEDPPLAP